MQIQKNIWTSTFGGLPGGTQAKNFTKFGHNELCSCILAGISKRGWLKDFHFGDFTYSNHLLTLQVHFICWDHHCNEGWVAKEKNFWFLLLYYSAKNYLSITFLFILLSSLSKNMIRVPMLVPGLEYTFEIQVECISDLGISDQLHVFVTRDQVCKCTNAYCYNTVD